MCRCVGVGVPWRHFNTPSSPVPERHLASCWAKLTAAQLPLCVHFVLTGPPLHWRERISPAHMERQRGIMGYSVMEHLSLLKV